MSDFPGFSGHPVTINPWSEESIGRSSSAVILSISGTASAVWPTGNTALYVPFHIAVPITVVKMATWNGATASGNIDIGLYNAVGTRIVSSGSTAQAGTSAAQEFDITDTLLVPGRYYMALTQDDGVGTFFSVAPGSNKISQTFGVRSQATALPLPATATFAACALNYLPVFWLTTRTVV